jgi:hypothetical protein
VGDYAITLDKLIARMPLAVLIIKMLPSVMELAFAAVGVDHARLPSTHEGGRISVSEPSGICLTAAST